MSGSNQGNIEYTVSADVQGFVDNMKAVPDQLGKAADGMEKTDKAAAKLGGELTSLQKSFAALGVAAAIKSAVSMIEKFDQMAEQVRMTSGSVADLVVRRPDPAPAVLGYHEVGHVVMLDPEGNEFCVA